MCCIALDEAATERVNDRAIGRPTSFASPLRVGPFAVAGAEPLTTVSALCHDGTLRGFAFFGGSGRGALLRRRALVHARGRGQNSPTPSSNLAIPHAHESGALYDSLVWFGVQQSISTPAHTHGAKPAPQWAQGVEHKQDEAVKPTQTRRRAGHRSRCSETSPA